MSITQHEAICMCCPSKRKYAVKVSDANRIYQRLYQMSDEKYKHVSMKNDKDDKDLYFKLKHGVSHVHFVCGCCSKVSSNELTIAEENMIQQLMICAKECKAEDNDSKYHDVLRLLSGHYPLMYKVVESFHMKG